MNPSSIPVSQFYDSALLYCHALYSILKKNGSISSNDTRGTTIYQYLRNVTIDGILGPISINENGDRQGNINIFLESMSMLPSILRRVSNPEYGPWDTEIQSGNGI